MSRDIFGFPAVMDSIAVIGDSEENKYSDIPGWEGECENFTGAAVCLSIKGTDVWFPFSHLRKAEDGQSIYASNWILKQKNL
jgi:hypothetical protein